MLHKLSVLVLPLKDTSKGISTGSTLVCYSLSLPSDLTGLLPLVVGPSSAARWSPRS